MRLREAPGIQLTSVDAGDHAIISVLLAQSTVVRWDTRTWRHRRISNIDKRE